MARSRVSNRLVFLSLISLSLSLSLSACPLSVLLPHFPPSLSFPQVLGRIAFCRPGFALDSRQNNAPSPCKNVDILIPRTCKYVVLTWQRRIKVADGIKVVHQLTFEDGRVGL